jgi:hypothetical protein
MKTRCQVSVAHWPAGLFFSAKFQQFIATTAIDQKISDKNARAQVETVFGDLHVL